MTLIIGIGGTARRNSATGATLEYALQAARALGADTELLGTEVLQLPLYTADQTERTYAAQRLVDAVRRADGVIIASPAYHGGMSGAIKNALDYVEDLRVDTRPYLDGRAVGCITCAYGWQGGVTTLESLRSVVHALRGWPTPFGAVLNSAEPLCGADGAPVPDVAAQLDLIASQVVQFARQRTAAEYRVG